MTTAKSEKAPNYSSEQLKEISNVLNIATLSFESQKQILEELVGTELFANKSYKQVLAKVQHLSASGVVKKVDNSPLYCKKEYLTKRKEKVISKAVIISEIAKLCNVEIEIMDSLAGATKAVLFIILAELMPEDEK